VSALAFGTSMAVGLLRSVAFFEASVRVG